MPKRMLQASALDACCQTSCTPPKLARDSMRSIRCAPSKPDHGADRLARVHQVEGFVDAFERQLVGDVWIQVDFAAHCLLHHARQLRPSLDPAECRAAPHAPGHQLEW